MQNTFGNFSTPMISVSDKKRKDTEIVNGPAVGKKPRGRPPGRKNQVQGQNTLPQSSNVVNNQVVSWQSSSSTLPPSGICAPNGSQVQGSNVAKGSFNHPLFFVPNHSQILETPPRTQSSHCDTYVSPTNFLVALRFQPIELCLTLKNKWLIKRAVIAILLSKQIQEKQVRRMM
ncbi:hypothetical protein AAZX31_03G066800 [Glycine max]|nr:hypothetical protein GLYMA_03G074233v4 [Glycine max]